VLIACIAAVTAWALIDRKNDIEDPAQEEELSLSQTASFTGIGRLRIPLASADGTDSGAVLIIRPVLPYNKKDAEFGAEIQGKTDVFKRIIGQFYSGAAMRSPQVADSNVAKEQLLPLLNAQLRLGRIKEIYFEEFMVIE
jgi:flagellar basal body-associated protein FliL